MSFNRTRFVQLENRRSYRGPDLLATGNGAALLALLELTEPIRPLFRLASQDIGLESIDKASWLEQLRALSTADVDLRDDDLAFERQLGEGAFASVELWRLHVDPSEPRSTQLLQLFPTGLVALKRVKRPAELEPEAATSTREPAQAPCIPPEAFELVLRTEAALLKMVPHRNIVACCGCAHILPHEGASGASDQSLVLVEEHLPGGTLLDKLRTGRYSMTQAVDWLIDVSSGLTALHGAGVTVAHRDLRPDNVMIAADGVAKLVDLGLARLMAGPVEAAPCAARELDEPGAGAEGTCGSSSGAGSVSLSDVALLTESAPASAPSCAWAAGTGAAGAGAADAGAAGAGAAGKGQVYTHATGSERYMAPENFLGGHYDHKVDVFSFAVIAFELLSRSRAYDGLYLAPAFIAQAVATKQLRPELPARWPAATSGLLSRCWAQSPSERPEMREVYSELVTLRDTHEAAELEALFSVSYGRPACLSACALA